MTDIKPYLPDFYETMMGSFAKSSGVKPNRVPRWSDLPERVQDAWGVVFTEFAKVYDVCLHEKNEIGIINFPGGGAS